MIVRGSETVLVQGITGKQGTFWSERMRDYGTKIVGGVNPKRAGEAHLGLPVWATARDAARETNIDATVMFIPPFGVKAAALDAIEAGIGKIVCLTEHVPVHDTMYILAAARERGTQVLGPNTAGIVTVGECFLGFMPAFNPRVFQQGNVGVISRSGSLGTLICLNIVQAGLGISAFVGIGGDPIIGTTTKDALVALDHDPNTKAVALVGEIGGAMEEEAAEYARTMQKPIAAFIAGAASPPGKRMGHAGAIVMGDKGSYAGKKAALEAAGVTVCATPSGVAEVLKRVWRLTGNTIAQTDHSCASTEAFAGSASSTMCVVQSQKTYGGRPMLMRTAFAAAIAVCCNRRRRPEFGPDADAAALCHDQSGGNRQRLHFPLRQPSGHVRRHQGGRDRHRPHQLRAAAGGEDLRRGNPEDHQGADQVPDLQPSSLRPHRRRQALQGRRRQGRRAPARQGTACGAERSRRGHPRRGRRRQAHHLPGRHQRSSCTIPAGTIPTRRW